MPEKELVRNEEQGEIAMLTLDDPPESTLAHQTMARLDAAISGKNQTIYGLAAGIWTRDVGKAHRVASEIQAGTVRINTYKQIRLGFTVGRLQAHGCGRERGREAALEKHTQAKSVWVAVAR